MERLGEKSRIVRFVENTDNISKIALINAALCGLNVYKDSQLPGAVEKMAKEPDPYFLSLILFIFVAGGSKVLAIYEKSQEK